MGKFGRTWAMMKSSATVLRQDKELMVFPVLSGIFTMLLLASFIAPLVGSDFFARLEDNPENENWVYLGLFLFYVLSYFIVIFFNAAIVACAMIRMDGGDPTVKDGLNAAMNRIGKVFAWAVVAGTVGFILRMIEERSQIAGKIVVALIGLAWTVASYLAVPVLVVEDRGPFDALKESGRLLKQSWGEQIIGNLGFGLVFFVLSLPAVGLVFGGIFLGNGYGVIGGIVLAAVYLLILGIVQSALQVIYQTAVYRYARDGQAPSGFDRELLATSIRQR
ncbi:MAG: DUF6159 family protein [Gammaproteobacteria bacterium]|nr:DUF6159 family protein [Gammaproteobacteria bacterium]